MLHHLRLCLATGGYTCRFTENPPTPVSQDQISPQLPLNTITDLLITCIDSVGPSGWISAIAAPHATATSVEDLAVATEMNLIEEMKSEVSATLAGIEEATYLKGILREYIRSSSKAVSSLATTNASKGEMAIAGGDDENVNVPAAKTTTPTPLPTPAIQYERLNGADLIIFGSSANGPDGDGIAADDNDIRNTMLPLSLGGAPTTDLGSRTKMKKSTGEVKPMSAREIGYLRRKAVGDYSFERLIL